MLRVGLWVILGYVAYKLTIDGVVQGTSTLSTTEYVSTYTTAPVYNITCGHCDGENSTCDPANGACPHGCEDGWNGTTCETPCNGTYGQNCSQTCGHCIDSEVCDNVDGTCKLCAPGFTGSMCNEICNGTYGQNCSQTCGHCNNSEVCDNVDGSCKLCAPGFNGSKCDENCTKGYYGQNCTSNCSTHCNTTCDAVTGHCQCLPGYSPPDCTEACNGTYGQNCSQTCGHCNNSEVCDNVDGSCKLCAPGFNGSKCDENCTKGYYGQNCTYTCSTHCNTTCDAVTGHCLCLPGYSPPNCTEECPNGKYGVNCSQSCGNCTETACNKMNGSCTCRVGYRPDTLCVLKCINGSYGQDCSRQCGECARNHACDFETGNCTRCKYNTKPPLCQDCQPGQWGAACSQLCGHCGGDGSCNRTTAQCLEPYCQDGWMSEKCDQKCQAGTFGLNCSQPCGNCMDALPCRHDNGFCESDCAVGYEGVLCQRKTKDLTAAIVGAVLGAAVIITLGLVVTLCYLMRERTSTGLSMNDITSPAIQAHSQSEESIDRPRPMSAMNYAGLELVSLADDSHIYEGDQSRTVQTTSPAFEDPIYQNSETPALAPKTKKYIRALTNDSVYHNMK